MATRMRRIPKHVPLATNRAKKKNENFFKLPVRSQGASKDKPLFISFNGLKPKTKYMVGIRNQDANKFEDITPWCYPGFGHKKLNADRTNKRDLYTYFVTNESGELSLWVRNQGTQNVAFPSGGQKPAFNKHWRHQKRLLPPEPRNNIILIEYAKVDNPTSLDKIKTIKTGINLSDPNTYPPKSLVDVLIPEPTTDNRYTTMRKKPDFIQSFYVDNKSVKNSKSVDITDITLYLRKKAPRNGSSGLKDPGILVTLLDMSRGQPVTSRFYSDSYSYMSWSSINASGDASAGTTFTFKDPVTVKTGRTYAFAVDVLDEDFELWKSIKGDRLVGTDDKPSPGSSPEHTGDLFERSSFTAGTGAGNPRQSLFRKNSKADLKFDVHVSEYTLDDVEFYLVNDAYEFLTLNANDEDWIGGEWVYKEANAQSGTISITKGTNKITGSGTTFTSGNLEDNYIVIRGANTLYEEIVKVDTVANSTCLYLEDDATLTISGGTYLVTPMAQVDDYFKSGRDLVCTQSTANTTMYFQANDTIRGIESDQSATISAVDNQPLSVYRSDFNMKLPPMFRLTTDYSFAQASGNTYYIASNASAPFPNPAVAPVFDLLKPNHIRNYESVILSRSNEVQHASNLYDGATVSNPYRGRSSAIRIRYIYTGSNTTSFECPRLKVNECNIITHSWDINNDATNEHTNNGNAFTKHISKPLSFSRDNAAEDIRVIYNSYKPANTDIKVFAKIINEKDDDALDDKYWTELELTSGEGQISSKDNPSDYREFEYGFPAYPASSSTTDGTITTSANSATITGSSTDFSTDFSVNEVVKLYSPLFPENYGVFCIESIANTTSMTFTEEISNTNVVGDGFKIDKLSTPHTAFNDADNYNIVKYFNEDGEAFDTYNTVVIKTVLLSDSPNLVPKVDDYRVIGVSA